MQIAVMPEGFFEWVLFILEKYYPLLLKGTWNTLIIAILGTVIGFIIGLVLAVLREIPIKPKTNIVLKILNKIMQYLITAYIEVFRGTPMIVQAMVIFYGSSQLLGIFMSPFSAAILIISINTASYMAEIIRGGIISVEKGQVEGAQSIGMNHWTTMVHVVLPQAIRNIMPSIGNEFVVNIKDSSVLNVISVSELFLVGKSAAGTYLRYFETFFIIAVVYLILTFTVTRILRFIEKKMDGDSSYTILGSQTDSASVIKVQKEAGTKK